MKVKVCGMRDADNIRDVEALGIDLMGFIFWPKSSRYVNECPAYLPTNCKRVGVFVDASIDNIRQHVAGFRLNAIQLHGNESPDFIRALRVDCGSTAVIKAFNIATADDLAQTKSYEGLVDYFLFDTRCQLNSDSADALPGGTGQQFDWSILSAYDGDVPFLLSGGIGSDDAPRLHQAFALDGFPVEKCIGIDLNSRFETAPGMKDIAALHSFLSQLTHFSLYSH